MKNVPRIHMKPCIGGVRLTGWYENGRHFDRVVPGVTMRTALDRLYAAWLKRTLFNVDALINVITGGADEQRNIH